MTSHAIVTSDAHRDLRININAAADLGDGVMACLAVPDEFPVLQNEFPILFRRDPETNHFSALALMGFEAGENLFLEDGRWTARYRPLALAIQPFLVGRPSDGDGPGQVHIDLDHPRVAAGGEGMRLFDDQGLASPYLERVSRMLGTLDASHRESPDFYAALERYGVLEPFALDVELSDGNKHRLVGYHLVSEERIDALEPGALAELHRDGHLTPMYMALASLTNLQALVDRKNRRNSHG